MDKQKKPDKINNLEKISGHRRRSDTKEPTMVTAAPQNVSDKPKRAKLSRMNLNMSQDSISAADSDDCCNHDEMIEKLKKLLDEENILEIHRRHNAAIRRSNEYRQQFTNKFIELYQYTTPSIDPVLEAPALQPVRKSVHVRVRELQTKRSALFEQYDVRTLRADVQSLRNDIENSKTKIVQTQAMKKDSKSFMQQIKLEAKNEKQIVATVYRDAFNKLQEIRQEHEKIKNLLDSKKKEYEDDMNLVKQAQEEENKEHNK